MELEAVLYREWGKWHAVVPLADGTASDRTFCGKNAIKAVRMYQKWDEKPEGERCANCVITMSHWKAGVI